MTISHARDSPEYCRQRFKSHRACLIVVLDDDYLVGFGVGGVIGHFYAFANSGRLGPIPNDNLPTPHIRRSNSFSPSNPVASRADALAAAAMLPK